jgi:hypothetical protein
VAIWAMPPVAYALASDTVIGVVRAWAVARQKELDQRLADDEVTPLAIVGGLLLWLLRLALAPASTVTGFRTWVLEECPVAPGRRARRTSPRAVAANDTDPGGLPHRARVAPRPGTKTAAFLAMVAKRYGPFAAIGLDTVSRICTQLAPKAGLDTGAARTALRKAVLAARDGGTQ